LQCSYTAGELPNVLVMTAEALLLLTAGTQSRGLRSAGQQHLPSEAMELGSVWLQQYSRCRPNNQPAHSGLQTKLHGCAVLQLRVLRSPTSGRPDYLMCRGRLHTHGALDWTARTTLELTAVSTKKHKYHLKHLFKGCATRSSRPMVGRTNTTIRLQLHNYPIHGR
jgi:hypothetical protein